MPDVPRREFVLGGMMAALAGCNATTGSRQRAPAPSLADTVVTTTDELEAAFDDLSAGDTIRISDQNAPYRTSQWLDVDVDGVTVVGPGIRNLVVPAGGANVGGIRIGHNRHCRDVDVRGVGYHGNPKTKDGRVKRLHGFIVRDATDVTIEGNYATRTHPYHEHNTGGSGISVEREARGVRVFNNHISDIGDRGIQLAGERITVSGNVIVDGFDRSVSCDAWGTDGENYHARNVSIHGNVMGGNPEGSLTGVGGGNPDQSDRGYFNISNNVGFGRHKSLCHVGFDGRIHNVQIDGNVSVQNADNRIAGVSIEITEAANVTVRDNDLYNYSGRGINVEEGIADFVVSGNTVYNSGQVGVRIAGALDGTVTGNYVNGTGRAGILLADAGAVTVSDNRLRRIGRGGIVARGDGPTRHEIRDNYLKGYSRNSDVTAPAILLASSGNAVRRNHVEQNGTPALVEGDGADGNCVVDNWADGPNPWRVDAANSTVRGNDPAVDAHRGASADGGTVTVEFETAYADPPKLGFGRTGGGVSGVSYVRDDSGNVVGARVDVDDADGTVDVFVEDVP